MSYNVDHVECLSGELTLTDKGKRWLRRANDGKVESFPECGPEVKTEAGGVEKLVVYWSGEGSGYAVDKTLKKFFSFTRGTAEFVFYWEGGDSLSGYRVVDGVVTEHEVEMNLGKEIK